MKANYTDLWSSSLSLKTQYLAVILTISLLPGCTFLSNRDYVQQYAAFQGTKRLAIFLQRWPVYLQKPAQNDLGEDFIKTKTYFFGPWKPAAQLSPRAVDIQDIDDSLVGEILIKVLERKGYQVFLVDLEPLGAESLTVGAIMAQYQAINPPVDAFLFCYYSPTLFLSHAQATPRDQARKSYSLQEIMQMLEPGTDSVIWVGIRGPHAPFNSVSHAFIFLSMTWFKALNWQMIMAEADSQVGGKVRPWIPRCPPGPTERDYAADAGVIRTLMVKNLECRLRHMIPDAFGGHDP